MSLGAARPHVRETRARAYSRPGSLQPLPIIWDEAIARHLESRKNMGQIGDRSLSILRQFQFDHRPIESAVSCFIPADKMEYRLQHLIAPAERPVLLDLIGHVRCALLEGAVARHLTLRCIGEPPGL